MRIIYLLMMMLCCPWLVFAQPNVETFVIYNGPQQPTHTTPVITPAGADQGLLACITSEQGGTDQTITSVVYAGAENFIKVIAAGEEFQPAASRYATIWYLPNPQAAQGSVQFSSVGSAKSSATIMALSDSQQTPLGLANQATCQTCVGSILTLNFNTQVNNTLLVGCGYSNNSTEAHDHGAGQVEITDFGAQSHIHSTSTKLEATPAATTMTLQVVTALDRAMAYAAVGVTPPGIGPTTVRFVPFWFTH